jgi:hypothetical protein
MKRTPLPRCVALAGLAAFLLANEVRGQYATYDSWDKNYTVQALLGAVQFENLKFDVPDADPSAPTEVDVSLIPQLGAAWGTLPKGDRFQYGLECSFLLGFRFDDINYLYAGGGGLYASISTSMWMFDLAGGPYASLFLDKKRRVRLYIGGGPLMTYADYRTDTEYPENNPGAEDVTESESAFGIGVYARTGFEFRIFEKGMLGLGARGVWSNVDFSEYGGSTDLAGGAVFVSFTAGL